MASETTEVVVIPAEKGLDPITVVLFDHGPRRGSVLVECYGSAWAAHFSGMGDRTIRQFIASTDSDYLSGKLASEAERMTPRTKAKGFDNYRTRVAASVIETIRSAATAPGAPEVGNG